MSDLSHMSRSSAEPSLSFESSTVSKHEKLQTDQNVCMKRPTQRIRTLGARTESHTVMALRCPPTEDDLFVLHRSVIPRAPDDNERSPAFYGKQRTDLLPFADGTALDPTSTTTWASLDRSSSLHSFAQRFRTDRAAEPDQAAVDNARFKAMADAFVLRQSDADHVASDLENSAWVAKHRRAHPCATDGAPHASARRVLFHTGAHSPAGTSRRDSLDSTSSSYSTSSAPSPSVGGRGSSAATGRRNTDVTLTDDDGRSPHSTRHQANLMLSHALPSGLAYSRYSSEALESLMTSPWRSGCQRADQWSHPTATGAQRGLFEHVNYFA